MRPRASLVSVLRVCVAISAVVVSESQNGGSNPPQDDDPVLVSQPLVGFTAAAWNERWPPVVVIVPRGSWDSTTTTISATITNCIAGVGSALAELPRLPRARPLGGVEVGTVAFGVMCDLPVNGTSVNVSLALGAIPAPMWDPDVVSSPGEASLPYLRTFNPEAAPWCGSEGVVGVRVGPPRQCAPIPGTQGVSVPGVTGPGGPGTLLPEPSPAPGSGSGSFATTVGTASVYAPAKQWVAGVDATGAAPDSEVVVVVAVPGAPPGARQVWTGTASGGCFPWGAPLVFVPLAGALGPWVALCPGGPVWVSADDAARGSNERVLRLSANAAATTVSNRGTGTLVAHSWTAAVTVGQQPGPAPAPAAEWANYGCLRESTPAGNICRYWNLFVASRGLAGLVGAGPTANVPLGGATVWDAGSMAAYWYGHPMLLGLGQEIVDFEFPTAYSTDETRSLLAQNATMDLAVSGCSLLGVLGDGGRRYDILTFTLVNGPGVYVAWCNGSGSHNIQVYSTSRLVEEDVDLVLYGPQTSGMNPGDVLELAPELLAPIGDPYESVWGAAFADGSATASRTPSLTPSPSSTQTPSVTPSPSPTISDSASTGASASPTASASASPSDTGSASETASISASASSTSAPSASYVPPHAVAIAFGGADSFLGEGATVQIQVGVALGVSTEVQTLVVALESIVITGCGAGVTPVPTPAPPTANEYTLECVAAGPERITVTVPFGAATFLSGGVQRPVAAAVAALPWRPLPVLRTVGSPSPGRHNGSALTVQAVIVWPPGTACPDFELVAAQWLASTNVYLSGEWVQGMFYVLMDGIDTGSGSGSGSDSVSVSDGSNNAHPCGTWVLSGVVQPGAGGFSVVLPELPWVDPDGNATPIPGAVLLVQALGASSTSSASVSLSRSVTSTKSPSLSPSPSISDSATSSTSSNASPSTSSSSSFSATKSETASSTSSISNSGSASRSGSVSRSVSRSRVVAVSASSGAGAGAVDLGTSDSVPVGLIAGVVGGIVAVAAGVALALHFRSAGSAVVTVASASASGSGFGSGSTSYSAPGARVVMSGTV